MTDETVTNAQVYSTTTTTNRGLERRSVYIDEQNNNLNKSSRKFRWSSCFSFISSKFKKSKSQKIPAAAYDIDELEHDKYVVSTENKVAVGPIDGMIKPCEKIKSMRKEKLTVLFVKMLLL